MNDALNKKETIANICSKMILRAVAVTLGLDKKNNSKVCLEAVVEQFI